MKKKLIGTILAAALIVSQVATVFAAGSRTADIAISGDSTGKYQVAEASEESFADVREEAPTIYNKIAEINEGNGALQSIVETLREILAGGDATEVEMTEEQIAELETELEGKDMVTPFFDLEPIDGGVQDAEGNYIVNLSVPSLTEAMKNVKLLHFSTERKLWEVIEPENVDYANKEIRAIFQDLSPVAVIADIEESAADNTVGTSPKTGVHSTWALWLGAGVVLAAGAVLAYRKRS